ncbi:MAG: dTDP-4-dehydrorhamnose reductase [Bacteroides sp.]|nr:dTDP-4-dehydrorhamnose reductase [Bacteroides sp.]MCM1085032.1 dTDP-4-dehydrorhamnose reductase [Bacteroides sp.]MCM1169622.1 dTDP-4-dehydrorhamnose reductase [Bacteroides sp.]
MTVLVTGCNGQLGSELRRLARDARCSHCRFLFVDRDVLDICSRADVQNYMKINKVDLVVNCAAYTAVDKAENDRALAFAVNSEGVSILAESCVESDAFMINISTDYVFDGTAHEPYTETDEVRPIGVYGLSKRAGENAMMEKGVRGMIIRTAWLYSVFGNNFVKTMLRLGEEKDQVMVVADQQGTPTWAADLADAIIRIILQTDFSKRQGLEIYHYSNEGECSWYEFASAIMQMAGKDCKVQPISTAEYPTSCRRPAYSVLDKTKIKQEFGIEIPEWDDSLRKMLDDLKQQ